MKTSSKSGCAAYFQALIPRILFVRSIYNGDQYAFSTRIQFLNLNYEGHQQAEYQILRTAQPIRLHYEF